MLISSDRSKVRSKKSSLANPQPQGLPYFLKWGDYR
jgi:hypothetical protein